MSKPLSFGEFLAECRNDCIEARQGATVLDWPMRVVEDDAWLTLERLQAYYVALSVNPEIVHAAAVVRDSYVDKVIAGLRAATKLDGATDAKGREQCIALMRQDEQARRERVASGGW